MYQPPVSALAVPGVCALIAFLSYSSQWLFGRIEPYPLDQSQAVIFNALVACIWICYYRAIITDPGRVPREGSNDLEPEVTVEASSDVCDTSRQPRRWCKKCKAPKPPRAHHCKECQRSATSPPRKSMATKLTGPVEDVSRRWIIIAHGPPIASLTTPSPISSGLSSMPSRR